MTKPKDYTVHNTLRRAHSISGENGEGLRRVRTLSRVAQRHVHGLDTTFRLGGASARPSRALAHARKAQRDARRGC